VNWYSITPKFLTPATAQGATFGWRDSMLWPLLFLAVGLSFVVIPCAAGSMMPGDPADSRYNLAMLEIVYREFSALLHESGFAPGKSPVHFGRRSNPNWSEGAARRRSQKNRP
jgi:hypothetical protein